MKILILIISSTNHPVYITLKNQWLSYMNNYSNIDCFFLEDNPDLKYDYLIYKNHFIIKQKETIIPGILLKTLFAISNLKDNYDFIIRTNLSSYWNFTNLLSFLSKLDIKSNTFFYASNIYGNDKIIDFPYGQGSCIILNNYSANFLIDYLNYIDPTFHDDTAIGQFFYKYQVPIYPVNSPVINNHIDFFNFLLKPNRDCFHIRIKCSYDIIKNHNKLFETINFIKSNYSIFYFSSDLNSFPNEKLELLASEWKSIYQKLINNQTISINELNLVLRSSLEPLFFKILTNIIGH